MNAIARDSQHPELIQRAVLHYAEHLEFLNNEDSQRLDEMERSFTKLEAFLWPDREAPFAVDPVGRADEIIEELKRRGLGNGR